MGVQSAKVRRRRTRVGARALCLAATASIWAAGTAGAQGVCDPEVTATPGNTGYGERSATVCEGLYRSNASAGLALVSLTHGEIPRIEDGEISVLVSVPQLENLSVPTAHLRGVGRAARLYYRLDVRVTPAVPHQWALGNVVLTEGMAPRDLGLFAWIEQRSDTLYMPVAVYSTGDGPDIAAPVYLWVRSNATTDRVVWSADGDRPRAVVNLNNHVPPGMPFRIDVSALRGRGIVELEVHAHVRGTDDWKRLTIDVRVAG